MPCGIEEVSMTMHFIENVDYSSPSRSLAWRSVALLFVRCAVIQISRKVAGKI
jgi:hypothetical protein